MALPVSKEALRKEYRRVRGALDGERKRFGAEALAAVDIPEGGFVLSFWSKGSEIETEGLNRRLCEKGRLALPRVAQGGLELFEVEDLEGLVVGAFGIHEPNPAHCRRLMADEVLVAFVPGLAFDERGHRLGYGRGYYDRCLESLPRSCHVFGVAFREQVVQGVLPVEAHDVAVAHLLLF